jgi:bacterioferritin
MPATEAQNQKIIAALRQAYNEEIETVANYIANSENLDGVRAKQIQTSLAADITEELGHAQLLASRIKTIGGTTPGSMELTMKQKTLQPPKDTTDVVTVIKGVIDAERGAIAGYENIIQLCDGVDYATQDMAITLLADEQQHLREFLGFLKEYENER